MKRLCKLLLALGSVIVSLGTALAQPNATMYVNGRFLYSAVGEKVVFRGVNEMFIYSSDKQGSATLPQIAQTGANGVRICWNTSGSASDLDALLGNAIANKIIPIVQLDNITGNIYGMQTCLDYWQRTDVMTAINKYKKWVIINIANEAGDNNTTDAQFQSVYTDAVSQLRTAGYTIPLVIDADGYGQNENAIINTWSAILQSDPQHNLLFSLHPYWKDTNTQNLQTRFTNVFNAVVSNNIPFIIGEGPQQTGYDCNTQIPYSWVMQQCQSNQIGWLVWTWGKVQDGTSNCGTTFDVTTNGNYGSWSNTWGQAIAVTDPNSIQNNSVRPPSIFGNTTPDSQAPTAPTNLAVANVTATGATLSWVASSDNVGVTGYTIYQGSTLLTTSMTNSISLTGLTCNTAYSFTVKARDAAGNVSAASNAANTTTGICDTQAPTAPTTVAASGVSPTNLTLSWTASTDNVGVTGYQVFRGSTLMTTQSGTSLAVTGLSCNTAYTFTVKATDAAGNVSAASNSVNVTTSACPTGEVVYDDALNSNWEDWTWSAYRYFNNTSPVQQGTNSIRVDYGGYGGFSLHRGSALTPSANTVLKFWVYSSGANALKVYTQSADSGGESTVLNFTTSANQWQEITVTMAALGNPSAIKRINIQENAGNSPTVFYDYIRFDTSTPPADTQAPTAPANLATSNLTQTGLTLNWTASTDNVGVTSYSVYRGTTLLNGSVNGTSFAVTGLTCGTAYAFTVKAKDAAGNVSTASNTANVTTTGCDTQAPSSPGGLAASSITQTGLTLTWTGSTDNVGVTGYQVYQGSTLLTSSVSGTTYTVTGLTCGTQYNFSVTAKDAAGNTSPVSNVITPTTSGCSGSVATTVMIYDDALAAGWDDWSWSTTRNFANTSPVKVGTKSLRLDYSAWSALSFHKASAAVNTSSSTAIRFWIYTPAATTIKVYTSSSDSNGDASGYTFTTTANTWTEQIITNSQLGSPTQIRRIQIQNYTGNSATAYIDNLQLVSVTGARIGVLEESSNEVTVFPNPTTGAIQIRYVANQAESVQLQVIDIKGTVLQQKAEQAEVGPNLFQLDVSQHDAGQYFIRLQSADGMQVKKVQVVR